MTTPRSYHEKTNDLLEKRMARYSAGNRQTMAAFIAAKRREGVRPKSLYGYVQALGHLDSLESAGCGDDW